MALTVNPTLPVIAAQGVGGATAGLVLQPGTVVNAAVLKVADNLVQIAIANLTIDVLSEVPLQAGQSLQLAVSQTQNGIRLAIVGQGTGAATADAALVASNAPVNAAAPAASPNDPLTSLERIAVSVASESAAAQQQSLAPLFANLSAAAASNSLPPALQQAVMQVLAQQTGLDQTLTGNDIQNAVQKSGLFLEAELASGAVSSTAGVPDLKAALIVLRQTLATSLAATEDPAGTATQLADASAPGSEAAPTSMPKAASGASSGPSPALAPSLSPELEISDVQSAPGQLPLDKAALVVLGQALENAGPEGATARAVLNLAQATLQDIPQPAENVPATATPANGPGENVAARTSPQPPPPFRGALPSAQPVAASSLPSNASLATIANRLLNNTDVTNLGISSTASWVLGTTTAATMIDYLNGVAQGIVTSTNEAFVPDTAVLPTASSRTGPACSRTTSS